MTDLVLHLALVIATPSVLHSEQPTGKKVVPTTRGGAVNYGSSCFKQGGRKGGGHSLGRSARGLFARAEPKGRVHKNNGPVWSFTILKGRGERASWEDL